MSDPKAPWKWTAEELRPSNVYLTPACSMCEAIGKVFDPRRWNPDQQLVVAKHLYEHGNLFLENVIAP